VGECLCGRWPLARIEQQHLHEQVEFFSWNAKGGKPPQPVCVILASVLGARDAQSFLRSLGIFCGDI
jgi:hypothetical protein